MVWGVGGGAQTALESMYMQGFKVFFPPLYLPGYEVTPAF